MKTLRLIWQWIQRRKGKSVVDYTKGCGYYITVGLWGHTAIGKEKIWKMESGKEMRVKLIDYITYSDPRDMIKESYWQFIGYVGEKPFAEMGLLEYLKASHK